MGARSRAALAVVGMGAVLSGVGCDVDVGAILGPDEGEFDFEGRRVGIIVDGEREICAGSVERLSREVERTEVGLGVGPFDDRVEIHLLENDATLIDRCGHTGGCYRGFPHARAVFERRDELGQGANYWIPFDRLDVEYFGDVPELLRHGVANAFVDRQCAVPDASLEELLLRPASEGLTVTEGRAVAQLVRAILLEHSAETFADWLAVLDASSPPDYVRATYAEFFDDDLDARWSAVQAQPALEPPGGWCDAAVLPPEEFSPLRWSVDRTVDCESPFVEGELGWGEYVIEQAIYLPATGSWVLEGVLPTDTRVETRTCRCSTSWVPRVPGEPWFQSEGWIELRVVSDAADGRRVRLELRELE